MLQLIIMMTKKEREHLVTLLAQTRLDEDFTTGADLKEMSDADLLQEWWNGCGVVANIDEEDEWQILVEWRRALADGLADA